MEALILARRDWRESDQVVTLLTRERGKVEALARGVKKIISKNSATLEPPVLAAVELVPSRERELLTTAAPLTSYSGLRLDFAKLRLADQALKLVAGVLPPGAPEPRLFDLLKDFLAALDSAAKVSIVAGSAFLLKMLAALGIMPEIKRCSVCGQKFVGALPIIFDYAAGGVVHTACASAVGPPHTRFRVNNAFVKLLATLAMSSWKQIFLLPIKLNTAQDLGKALAKFAEFHLGKTLK